MDLSFYHTAVARNVKCGTQVSQTVGKDQTSLGYGRSGWHMHRSDIGQALMVNHTIRWIETKIDSVNVQVRFIPAYCTLCMICVLLQYVSANMQRSSGSTRQSKLCMHRMNTPYSVWCICKFAGAYRTFQLM